MRRAAAAGRRPGPAARLRLLDERSHLEICSHPGRGTAIRLYLPLIEPEEEDLDDDPIVDC